MATDKKHRVFEFLEGAANFIGLAGGIPAIAGRLGKAWGAMPTNVQEHLSQKMPGFMGLDTKDEEIFNSLLIPKLNIEEQKVMADFLDIKCQEFQSERFRLIVTRMEVTKGTPKIIEKKWNETAKQFEEKIILEKDEEDLRLKFLKGFCIYIKTYGQDEAYKFCRVTGMFKKYSTFQNIKHSLGAAGEGIAEQALKVSKASTFQSIKHSFGTGGKEVAKQALRDAIAKRKGR